MHRVEQASKLVKQWCPAIEDTVTLRVQGSVFSNIIRGRVVECLKQDCTAKSSPYCWLERIIQTRL